MDVQTLPLNIKLYGIAREEIIKRVFACKHADNIIIVSEADTEKYFSICDWDKIRNNPIVFEYTELDISEIVDEIINDEEKQEGLFNQYRDKDNLHIQISVSNGKYHIPINIVFRERMNESGKRERKSFVSSFDGGVVEYQVSNSDMRLVLNVIEIMSSLQFIDSVEKYDDIYKLLQIESIDGRHIKSVLEKQFEQCGMTEKENRLNTITSYEKSPYMRKRWKTYLKKTGRKNPEWENVITTFTSFLKPIIDAIEEDKVFFGDWMPELQRYLD